MLPNSYPEYLSAPVFTFIRYSPRFLDLHRTGLSPKSKRLRCVGAEVATGTSLNRS